MEIKISRNLSAECYFFFYIKPYYIFIGEELLTPTEIYVECVLPSIRNNHIKALAHITGGGLMENIPRILPKNKKVILDATKWKIHPVFGWIAATGILYFFKYM